MIRTSLRSLSCSRLTSGASISSVETKDCSPGKPLVFATTREHNRPLIGLPGNPASTLVTFALLARPYLLRRQGVQELNPLQFRVPAGFDWPKAGNRREYLRGRLEQGRAIIYRNQSSGVLTSVVWADGLVDLPSGQVVQRGDTVRLLPLSALIGA